MSSFSFGSRCFSVTSFASSRIVSVARDVRLSSLSLRRSFALISGSPPFFILDSCEYTEFGFSNRMPISVELHMQYAQWRIYGSVLESMGMPSFSPIGASLTDRGDIHIGH